MFKKLVHVLGALLVAGSMALAPVAAVAAPVQAAKHHVVHKKATHKVMHKKMAHKKWTKKAKWHKKAAHKPMKKHVVKKGKKKA